MTQSTTTQSWPDRLAQTLTDLDRNTRRRYLREIASAQTVDVQIDGKEYLLCCTNDYLGLAADRRLKETARAAIDRWGTGAGASRLISGSMSPHHTLETTIADWKGSEAALLFNSGYQANLGILSTLVGRGDIVYSDALNHASLIDGCRLSNATVRIYDHNDHAHLESLLAADRHHGGQRLIVTDTVFSMDADEAPLLAICDLAEHFGAWVMVDEAHAGGVLGPEGAGLVADLGLQERVAIQMGTLGKALGSFGAYVAGSRRLIDVLLNRARSFVFTTALPPAVAATSQRAIEIVRSDDALRQAALAAGSALRSGFAERGIHVLPGRVPIVPVVIGDDAATMRKAQSLFEQGILAVGIRPPTVPEDTARIRFTVSARHTAKHIARILAAWDDSRSVSTP